MDLGIKIADDCLTVYEEMRMEKKLQYVIYRNIGNKAIEIDRRGERGETFQDFIQ